MKCSEELEARGFIYQHTAESVAELFDGEPRTIYLGIDPTADAIHVGNLVPYLLLNHLLKAGHKVILLLGGGTALIGDPSGRDSERDFVDVAVVEERCQKMEQNIRALTRGDVLFVNNYDWLSKLTAVEFLRDVGKHFTVNSMIKKDSVATRLGSENGISFTEFSYALLQSYDYYHLNQTYGCDLQIGGSDQWGNITAGIDYIRRITGQTVHGVTMQLVVDKATGKKFGKSMGNAVWLDAAKTSPYELYQFWLNTNDESVIPFLKLFTFISLEEITTIELEFQANPGERLAQKRLAYEVVAFVHGEAVATSVAKVAEVLFGGQSLAALTQAELEVLKANAPRVTVVPQSLIVDVLIAAELATSKREARTFITSGAVEINDTKISDVEAVYDEAVFGTLALLKRGKKERVVLEVTE
jgi:tyrosyl-tRNA synthetase